MEIDVFDFDGTIYDGDSTVDFLKYLFSRRPWLLLFVIRPLLLCALLKMVGRFSLTRFKSDLFSALAGHISLTEEAGAFWSREKTKEKLGEWYLSRKKRLPIVIASASPDFELRWAAEMLGCDLLICTRCDPETGRLIGENCKSAEKIRRIGQALGAYTVRAMYTDDPAADGPLLQLAEEKYLVRHGRVSRLDEG